MKPRCTLSENQCQQIYDFWLSKDISIPNRDRRSGCSKIGIKKLRYMREYKHAGNIKDANRKETNVTSKKTNRDKTCVTAYCEIYT